MKKINFLAIAILAILSLTISSCKKDIVADVRDKFVGAYQGTQIVQFTVSGQSSSSSSTSSMTIDKSSSNSNQIIINGNELGNVNSNSYTYVEFTKVGQDATYGAIPITFNGVGTLNGSNLIVSGTCTAIIQGIVVDGTWSYNAVKQ